jgi:hypothetical protein
MKHLISLKKLSINELNSKLNNFKYERIDKKNKFPKDIFKENSFDENSFSMTATHVWTLCKIFPLIKGEKLKDDILYMHFVSLLEIFQILNGDKFNENILQELEERIFQYLSEFKSLYNRPITAKLHFLLHYPRSIRNFGAPREFSTMRFESKHSYFKKVQQATHNHINLIKSLASRHQYLQSLSLASSNYFSSLELGTKQRLEDLYVEIIKSQTDIDIYSFFNWIDLNGIEYHVNDIFIKCVNQKTPTFSTIRSIVYDGQNIFFLLDDLITMYYWKHYTGYLVKEIEHTFNIYNWKNIFNPMPIDRYLIDEIDNIHLVTPKYCYFNYESF